ncbi:MAG: hypothetical protein AAF625_07105 [Pseudomonadota bacterium]
MFSLKPGRAKLLKKGQNLGPSLFGAAEWMAAGDVPAHILVHHGGNPTQIILAICSKEILNGFDILFGRRGRCHASDQQCG